MRRAGGGLALGGALSAAVLGLLLTPAATLAHSEAQDSPLETQAALEAAYGEAGHDAPGSLAPAAEEPAAPALQSYDAGPGAARVSASDHDRYTLAGGCFALRSADAGTPDRAEPYRLQATGLGSYLLLGPRGRFLGIEGGRVRALEAPGRGTEWAVREAGPGTFELRSAPTDRPLAADPRTGELVLAEGADAGPSGRFRFDEVAECAAFPEVEVNATGRPNTSAPRYGEATGLIDIHAHILAFEAFGKGGFHCGRPWHPLGAPAALADCQVEHTATPSGVAGNLLTFQDPAYPHHPGGWPDFEGWPTHQTVFLHERAYYRWIERAWRGGLRILTMLAVDNSGACQLNVQRTESCNEMAAVRRQLRSVKELQDYIDAQSGGPGKGWFRIVRNPFRARRVINRGKLAVILGIEVSEPFDCGVRNGRPQCDRDQIDAGLDEVFSAGVRQMELINKFDNAFAGVAMDPGAAGPVVNTGNKNVTGEFWEVETCTGKEADKTQITNLPESTRQLIALLPGGSLQLPAYPPPPHCNVKGLTDLGRYAIRGMAKRGIIFDPDHMSALAISQSLDLVEAIGYPGVVSSHGWANRISYRRILRLGGVVTPGLPSAPEGYVESWMERREDLAKLRGDSPFLFGFGFGSDVNGFGGGQGPAKGTEHEISYPFHSLDGAVKLARQRSGTRTYDYNSDGVAHYGLHPDYFEGVRKLGRRGAVRDSLRGAEAYLQMWERAVGVPAPDCGLKHSRLSARGLGPVRLGARVERVLRRAGQPKRRRGRTFTYCAGRGDAVVVFTPAGRVALVASSSSRHRARGGGAEVVGAERVGGRRYEVVAERSVARDASRLRRYLRLVRR